MIDRAAVRYRKAIEIDTNFTNAHIDLGIALVAVDRLQEALPHFKRAVILEPELPAGRYNLAIVLQKAGAGDRAIAHYNWLIGSDPGIVAAHGRSGLTHLAANRVLDAIVRLRRVVVLEPEPAKGHYPLGLALGRWDSVSAGRAHRRWASDLDPGLIGTEDAGF